MQDLALTVRSIMSMMLLEATAASAVASEAASGGTDSEFSTTIVYLHFLTNDFFDRQQTRMRSHDHDGVRGRCGPRGCREGRGLQVFDQVPGYLPNPCFGKILSLLPYIAFLVLVTRSLFRAGKSAENRAASHRTKSDGSKITPPYVSSNT